MAQGVVKSYDPNSGNGIVVLDTDKSEVYLQPGSLKGSIFRTLRQGQRINFEVTDIEGVLTISNVKIGQGGY
ncbi:cold shock domain-containing protein [Candidatus Actinomarina sp.]|jgi:cold shock CspA family protein|nr:cold shock domain-containing protein [Acidimicrobiia bacterium]MDA7850598.1 cold shock domain-containing protein [Acidimicrobiaceae bacterium]MDA8652900.1 cold shock domain-containing protein [Candidatus Actinomarina sp.]MDA7548212.1 cold shock domain-containing protein [Acidimicrobiia bacterium]MDA8667429.1 cold shock domain-containing protein [Candidatus Actinomarina sp.]|tara:strand:- start:6006 stop:6221 length:216 start_codon:yes stop_codon:yes gene_type:complete